MYLSQSFNNVWLVDWLFGFATCAVEFLRKKVNPCTAIAPPHFFIPFPYFRNGNHLLEQDICYSHE